MATIHPSDLRARYDRLQLELIERTAMLRLALVICQNQDGTDQDDWAMWAAMCRSTLKISTPAERKRLLEQVRVEAAELREKGNRLAGAPPRPGTHPEHREGLLEALKIVAYHKGAPLTSASREYQHALDRVENTIKAELENGGPLTSDVMAQAAVAGSAAGDNVSRGTAQSSGPPENE